MDAGVNVIEKILGVCKEYITISPNKFKKGHGSCLSIKVVLPCYCQANCSFCFNKLTINTQKHDYDLFFNNLSKTLDMIFNNVDKRPISLDITGNEPTFNINIFSRLMDIIAKYKSKIEKIVLTTNGFNLEACIPALKNVVDIVNISIHHYDYLERQKVFGTSFIPNDDDLKRIISTLKENKITCTAVAVLFNKIDDFNNFYNNFLKWAINLGFKDIRMRSNFCENDDFIDSILNIKMKNESMNIVGGLTTKIIIDEKTGFETYILKGVPDLTDYVVGAELVVDDDGLCYVDYNKRYVVDTSNIKYFNNFFVLNPDLVNVGDLED